MPQASSPRAPGPPQASTHILSGPQGHASATQIACGRPSGASKPGGASKPTHCARSWQGLPRPTTHAIMAWMPYIAPVHCGAGGSGQPRAAGAHQSARLTVYRGPRRRIRSASSVAAWAWATSRGCCPAPNDAQRLSGRVGMRERAGQARRVRRHAGFVCRVLRACGCGGGERAASVPCSLCAVSAQLAVPRPTR